jgi:hypothetical protein
MRFFDSVLMIGCMAIIIHLGCSKPAQDVTELKHFPLDTMEGLITRSDVEIDKGVSFDGHGSLKISTVQRTVVRLFELRDIDIEDARLVYEAKVRTEKVDGPVSLKMWCHFTGKGEYFSQGLEAPLVGTNEWTTLQTAFSFRAGENPDAVHLQLVVDGSGTVWIDAIRLIKGPPRWQ